MDIYFFFDIILKDDASWRNNMYDNNIWIFSDEKSKNIANIILNSLFSLRLSDNLKIFDSIKNIEQLKNIKLENENQIIYFIFENKEMSTYISNLCIKKDLVCFDIHHIIFGMLSNIISKSLTGESIDETIEEYLNQEFVNFALKNDDGKNPHSILESDIVIIGVSRTTKTPLSIYMSNLGYKVTNIPLVPEINIPMELLNFPKEKIFALTIKKERLVALRNERIKSLGLPKDAVYASVERVEEEIIYAGKIVEKLQCRTIDVSDISIEETSDIIKNLLQI